MRQASLTERTFSQSSENRFTFSNTQLIIQTERYHNPFTAATTTGSLTEIQRSYPNDLCMSCLATLPSFQPPWTLIRIRLTLLKRDHVVTGPVEFLRLVNQ